MLYKNHRGTAIKSPDRFNITALSSSGVMAKRAAIAVLGLVLTALAVPARATVVFDMAGSGPGVLSFTIPSTGLYQILAVGAPGGSSSADPVDGVGTIGGGTGAEVQGDFFLTSGESLSIILGDPGAPSTAEGYGGPAGGGGGGTFVLAGATPLIIAGGGGGGSYTGNPGGGGAITTSGSAGYSFTSDGGAGGGGMNGAGGGGGGGGGGPINVDSGAGDSGSGSGGGAGGGAYATSVALGGGGGGGGGAGYLNAGGDGGLGDDDKGGSGGGTSAYYSSFLGDAGLSGGTGGISGANGGGGGGGGGYSGGGGGGGGLNPGGGGGGGSFDGGIANADFLEIPGITGGAECSEAYGFPCGEEPQDLAEVVITSLSASSVPEPAGSGVLVSGVVGLLVIGRRGQRRTA